MATLTVDRRSGKVVGWNIQWCENRRRYGDDHPSLRQHANESEQRGV